MWRQFTQWLGGMGIIILAVAVLPRLRVGGRQMMESELPGPEVSRLPDRIRQTARLLWVLYIGLTALLALASRVARVARHRRRDDAVRGARARVHDDADGRLLDAGGLDRRLLRRDAVDHRALHVHRGRELRAALPRSRQGASSAASPATRSSGCTSSSALARRASRSRSRSGPTGSRRARQAIRAGVFQAVSIITTTGFATLDFATWPVLLPADALRAHVRGRLGGLDDGLDQGRAPPARSARCSGASSTRR